MEKFSDVQGEVFHHFTITVLLLLAVSFTPSRALCPTSDPKCRCSSNSFTNQYHLICDQLGYRTDIPSFQANTQEYTDVVIGNDDGASTVLRIGPRAFNGLKPGSLILRQLGITYVDIDAFYGIGDYVVSIDLSNNNITNLPNGVFRYLSKLNQLYLTSNLIVNPVSSWFDGASNLNWLELSNNRMLSLNNGPFSNLIQLTNLYLQNNRLGTITYTGFTGLSNLLTLDISSNLLSSIDSQTFNELPALSDLNLDNNEISSLAETIFSVAGETLSSLSLQSNKITTTSLSAGFLSKLSSTKMLRLYLSDNDITTIPDGLFSHLTSLELLDLSSNPLSTVNSNIMRGLSNLTELNLENTRVTSVACDVFDELLSVMTVSLSGNGISDVAATLTNGDSNDYCWPPWIQHIDLSSNNITRWPSLDRLNTTTMPNESLILNNNSMICDCQLASHRNEIKRLLDGKNSVLCAKPSSVFSQSVVCYDPRMVPCLSLRDTCTYDPWDLQGCAAIDGDANGTQPVQSFAIYSSSPLEGPVAGGTVITVMGEALTNSAVLKVTFVRSNESVLAGIAHNGLSSENTLYLETPPGDQINTLYTVSLELCNGNVIDTNVSFIYRQNPSIISVQPLTHLISGGTKLTVTGQGLSLSKSPKLRLSVTTTNNTVSAIVQDCFISQTAMTLMCVVPSLGTLPVATVNVSFSFDNYVTLPPSSILFYPPPQIVAPNSVIIFYPLISNFIAVQGQNFLRGSRASDYSAKIGNATCEIISVTNTEFTCRPPASLPNSTTSGSCGISQFELKISVGFATLFGGCVEYQTPTSAPISTASVSTAHQIATAAPVSTAASDDKTNLIVGLVVGIGVPLLIVGIVIAVVICRIRATQQKTLKALYQGEIPAVRWHPTYIGSRLKPDDDNDSRLVGRAPAEGQSAGALPKTFQIGSYELDNDRQYDRDDNDPDQEAIANPETAVIRQRFDPTMAAMWGAGFKKRFANTKMASATPERTMASGDVVGGPSSSGDQVPRQPTTTSGPTRSNKPAAEAEPLPSFRFATAATDDRRVGRLPQSSRTATHMVPQLPPPYDDNDRLID